MDESDLPNMKRDQVLKDVKKTIETDIQALIDQSTSYTEVSFHAKEGQELTRGQMDLVLKSETLKKLWVIDYKTGKRPAYPSQKYKNQLQTYAKFLQSLYPTYDIFSALFWVEEGRLERL
jgi:ATP-dependent exoDNAse (exonuclease V) beta subunit